MEKSDFEGAGAEAERDASGDRGELVRRFTAWLGAVLEAEEPPAGLPEELIAGPSTEGGAPLPDRESDEAADRYAVWSAMTALTQEVKLQGRAFRQLDDTLRPLAEARSLLAEAAAACGVAAGDARKATEAAQGERAARDADLRQEVERRVRREMLSAMVDVHERLRRGLDTSRKQARPRRGRWEALFGGHRVEREAAAAIQALEEGYRLNVDDLEERLGRWGVREISAVGRAFEPERMNAVDVAETDAVAEGTVVEVYRAGYLWHDEVLRPAQVKVARAPRRTETEAHRG